MSDLLAALSLPSFILNVDLPFFVELYFRTDWDVAQATIRLFLQDVVKFLALSTANKFTVRVVSNILVLNRLLLMMISLAQNLLPDI